MDEDVKTALDELRAEMRDALRARTPAQRQAADRDVAAAREELEDVLRREGYRLSRRELDELVDQRDAARQRDQFERWYEEKRAAELAAADSGDGDGGDGDTKDGETKKKPPAKKDGPVDEEKEWT